MVRPLSQSLLYRSVCGVVTEEGRQDLEEALTAEEYQMVTAASDFKIKTFFFGDLLGEVP